MQEWLNRHVRCVTKTARTSVIIGQVSDIRELSPGEFMFDVDVEGTLTNIPIDVELWAIETLDGIPRLHSV